MHKAGLELSNDVKELLFPEKLQINREEKSRLLENNWNFTSQKLTPETSQSNSLIDTMKEIPETQSQPQLQSEPQTATSSSTSIGSKLLMQFKQLHARKGVERPKKEVFEDEDEDEEDDEDEDEDQDEDQEENEVESNDENENDTMNLYEEGVTIKDGPSYLPVEIVMPVDQSGKILVSDECINKSKKLLEDNKFRKEKLKYILERDPAIQVSLHFPWLF